MQRTTKQAEAAEEGWGGGVGAIGAGRGLFLLICNALWTLFLVLAALAAHSPSPVNPRFHCCTTPASLSCFAPTDCSFRLSISGLRLLVLSPLTWLCTCHQWCVSFFPFIFASLALPSHPPPPTTSSLLGVLCMYSHVLAHPMCCHYLFWQTLFSHLSSSFPSLFSPLARGEA